MKKEHYKLPHHDPIIVGKNRKKSLQHQRKMAELAGRHAKLSGDRGGGGRGWRQRGSGGLDHSKGQKPKGFRQMKFPPLHGGRSGHGVRKWQAPP